MWIVGILVSIAVGGLFASKTTLTFPVLSFIPAVVHVIVGWLIIILTLISLVLAIIGKFK